MPLTPDQLVAMLAAQPGEAVQPGGAVQPGEAVHPSDAARTADSICPAGQATDLDNSSGSFSVALARQNQWDVRLGSVLQAGPIPQGLAERVLGRLTQRLRLGQALEPGHHSAVSAADSRAAAQEIREVSPAPSAATHSPRENSAREFTRRRWLAWAGGGGAAVLAVAAGAWFWPRRPALTLADLYEATSWLDESTDAAWRTAAFPYVEHPLPRVFRYQPHRWQAWSNRWGVAGVIYDFGLDNGPAARLFAIRQTEPLAGSRIPARPQLSTQGVNVIYWQEVDQLYVFVVGGAAQRYQYYLNLNRDLPVA
jgi:hypothetical protein